MAAFSEDRDILKYEPELFNQYYFQSQVLGEGTGGTLSSTSFTVSGEDFISASVSPGCVIHLEATGLTGCAYEVVSVDSATQLTVSVLRARVDDEPVAPPSASDVSYRISTFAPMAEEVKAELMECFGILASDTDGEIDINDILDKEVLRRASVFLLMSRAYGSLASEADDEHFFKKSNYYQSLYEKARQRCRIDIDINGDGEREETIGRGIGRLIRD
ncbi:MAG: hypothetical protein ACYTFM_08155 [Planctomycetota bacterium]|jgi:hypothetical protein